MRYDTGLIKQAATAFKKHYDGDIEWAIVLGSGLRDLRKNVKIVKEIPFGEIPNIPTPKVEGHGGKFTVATIENKTILMMEGRNHMYEGFTAFQVSLPVAMMGELGVKKLILTNAAGGINQDYNVGDIMVISDHINLQADNPLVGIPDSSKFIDASQLYDKEIGKNLEKEFNIRHGVYGAMLGPSYETPAEIRFLRTIGADAAGMSTAQEAIMARYWNMKVVGLSLISNMASGISKQKLNHEEVLEAGQMAAEQMLAIIRCVMVQY